MALNIEAFSAILGFTSVYYSISTVLFILRRRKQPIKAHNPLILLATTIGSFTALVSILYYQSNLGSFNCLAYIWILIFATGINLGAYVFRGIRLLFIFNMSQKTVFEFNTILDSLIISKRSKSLPKVQSDPKDTNSKVTTEIKPQSEQKIRTYRNPDAHQPTFLFDDNYELDILQKYVIKKEYIIMVLIIIIPIICALVITFMFPDLHEGCSNGIIPIGVIYTLISLMFCVVCILIALAIALRKVQDLFNIKNEITLITIFILVFGILFLTLYTLTSDSLIFVAVWLPLPLILHSITIIWPLFKSYTSSDKTDLSAHTMLLSFSALLENPTFLKYFKEFCAMEFSLNNLTFCIEMKNDFKISMLKADVKMRAKLAENINKKYFSSESINELNIDQETRNLMSSRIEKKEFSIDMFKEVEESVMQTLELDSFIRFTSSQLCKKFLWDIRNLDIHGMV